MRPPFLAVCCTVKILSPFALLLPLFPIRLKWAIHWQAPGRNAMGPQSACRCRDFAPGCLCDARANVKGRRAVDKNRQVTQELCRRSRRERNEDGTSGED